MTNIILLDTSIYLNLLDVPGYNQEHPSVVDAFLKEIGGNSQFILPLATVWETGNAISRIPDGDMRRKWAAILVSDVQKALDGNAPYVATHFPERQEFFRWLSDFPDHAMRGKPGREKREGASLADLLIIKEWERNCSRNPRRRVRVWSLDHDLAACDRTP